MPDSPAHGRFHPFGQRRIEDPVTGPHLKHELLVASQPLSVRRLEERLT